MKITITKHQLDLLNKRNAASEAAISAAKSATLVAQAQRGAFEDVVSCFSAAEGVKPDTEFAGIKFGTAEDGSHFLELIEQPKAE